jgi:hypothetical protein
MQTGTRISAIGHGVLVALAVFGLPWFGPRERAPIRVTDVSFISEADFEAAQSAAPGPREETAPAKPPAPRPVKAAEEKKPEPPSDVAPEVAAVEPPAEAAEATPAEPEAPARVTPHVVTLPETAATPPAPRRPPRVAPEPTPAPPEDLKIAEIPKPAPTPEPDVQIARVEEPPAAKPEAAPLSEAAPAPQAPLALETSTPPKKRQAPKPAPEKPAEKPAAKPKPDEDTAAVMAALVKKAATPATRPSRTDPTPPTPAEGEAATSLPEGPPLTSSEKDGLRLAVQRCWNVPAGLRDAGELKVTLAAELAADGAVINASIRLIEPRPAPDARFQQAYEAGRRALIRCSPYADLPRDKYGQWRDIEVVFNPEGIVSW